MKVSITDVQALRSRDPRSIRLYLRAAGWAPEGHADGSIVWRRSLQGYDYEVMPPADVDARDYAQRVAELVSTLSIVEDRSELAVFRSLATSAFDIHYIHTPTTTPTGTAPIGDAAKAMRNAQSLLLAAAHSVDDPRLVQPHRRSAKAGRLIRKVLAGPTSEGSYVLSVLVPVPPLLTPDEDGVLFDAMGEPYEREVTRRLYEAVASAHDAAVAMWRYGDLDAFTDRVGRGVSANLCEALVGLAGDDATGLELQFSWALDRPQRTTPPITFRQDLLLVMGEAATALRAVAPEENETIRGYVVRLHREVAVGPGDVTIAGVIVGDEANVSRRVNVNLSEPDYDYAIVAHDEGHIVEITGNLLRRGSRTYLREARDFVRVSDDND